ncbi:MAG TPA: MaoC family dehydratase [Candidatus Saccharimonadales bacterium]|jgi:acyl dehydratase|nr:MaoC family dehydratase [Candidatus Saccharimonadales bacterium]
MFPLTIDSLDALKDHVGRPIATTDWMPVTQQRIQQFAETTGDHQWIHVDPERARRESPFKSTIAHGFLTLSLLPQMMPQVMQIKNGVRMGVNYGINRLRFVSPVLAGMKIRGQFTLQSVKELPEGIEAVFAVTVEGEGVTKPCCVVEWVVRYYR